MSDRAKTRALAFHDLHRTGCFVIPNPWDAGSAKILHHLGFKALATTSAGLAFSRGLPDEVSAMSVDAVLEDTRDIVAATPLPVSADFQAGYARDEEGVAANVERCIATGVAGLSIEDVTGDKEKPLYDHAEAVARVRAARRAIDASGVPVVLTARCEAWLVGHPDAQRVTLERFAAFAEAGADCFFAPRVRGADAIAELVKAVAPKPLNVVVAQADPSLTVARLADLGVRRISVGSGFSRVAWGAVIRAATSVLETGTFDGLAGAASFSDLDAIFSRKA